MKNYHRYIAAALLCGMFTAAAFLLMAPTARETQPAENTAEEVSLPAEQGAGFACGRPRFSAERNGGKSGQRKPLTRQGFPLDTFPIAHKGLRPLMKPRGFRGLTEAHPLGDQRGIAIPLAQRGGVPRGMGTRQEPSEAGLDGKGGAAACKSVSSIGGNTSHATRDDAAWGVPFGGPLVTFGPLRKSLAPEREIPVTEDETLSVDYASLVDQEQLASEIEYIGKTLKGEYNHYASAWDKMQAAAVVWCILWRAEDTTWRYWPDDVAEVVTQEGQFNGYRAENWIDPELREIAVDVLGRWIAYKDGASLEEVGCVLPPQYLWFYGRGGQNWFRDRWDGEYSVWAWEWENPYEEAEA